MDETLRQQLEDVFGTGAQPSPGGTGAVLVRPSKLSMDLAQQVIREMPLDGLYRDLGAVAAMLVADELESRGLRPADYATLPELPQAVARRLGGYLLRSGEFSTAFVQNLMARG
jgi:hypothetical protein